MTFMDYARFLFVAVLVTLLSACVAAGNSPKAGQSNTLKVGSTDGNIRVVNSLPEPAEQLRGGDPKLSPNDIIEIEVFQVNDLNRTVEIGDDGYIALPLIGRTKAAGFTQSELATRIAQAYSQNYLESPQVSVFVKSSAGLQVTIDGEVRKSGILQVNSKSTLGRVIAQAGGLNEIADPAKVYVFRNVGKEKQVAQLSLKDIRSGKARDPRIYGGDVIVVFSSSSKVALRNLKDTLGALGGARALVPL